MCNHGQGCQSGQGGVQLYRVAQKIRIKFCFGGSVDLLLKVRDAPTPKISFCWTVHNIKPGERIAKKGFAQRGTF